MWATLRSTTPAHPSARAASFLRAVVPYEAAPDGSLDLIMFILTFFEFFLTVGY